MASGHVDADQNLDLVLTDVYYNQVVVLPGNADGTFRKAKDFSTGNAPVSAAIADLDGDGKSDLVTANSISNTISVLLGAGKGTFKPYVDYASAQDPEFVLAVDLNDDGKPDVLTANRTGKSFSVFLNDGRGAFPSHTDYALSSQSIWLAVGDFNHDGNIDVAALGNTRGSASGSVTVFLGDGHGGFSKGVSLAGHKGSYSVVVGDLNSDGNLDIVIANATASNISAFLGNGDGTFSSEKLSSVPQRPGQILLGDFNRDGKLDVAAIDNDFDFVLSCVSLVLGRGDGTFTSANTYAVLGSVAGAAGDFNHDGTLDVVSAGTYEAVSVLLNEGTK
jgi:hypothetical protein